jgi:hypothetical protein
LERYKYYKLPDWYKDYDIKKFFTEVRINIQSSIVEAKKRQLRFRLSLGEGNTVTPQKPEFSCIATAKLLGYSSASVATGAKYRTRFFRVFQEHGIMRFLSPSNLPFYRYPCGRISLA